MDLGSNKSAQGRNSSSTTANGKFDGLKRLLGFGRKTRTTMARMFDPDYDAVNDLLEEHSRILGKKPVVEEETVTVETVAEPVVVPEEKAQIDVVVPVKEETSEDVEITSCEYLEEENVEEVVVLSPADSFIDTVTPPMSVVQNFAVTPTSGDVEASVMPVTCMEVFSNVIESYDDIVVATSSIEQDCLELEDARMEESYHMDMHSIDEIDDIDDIELLDELHSTIEQTPKVEVESIETESIKIESIETEVIETEVIETEVINAESIEIESIETEVIETDVTETVEEIKTEVVAEMESITSEDVEIHNSDDVDVKSIELTDSIEHTDFIEPAESVMLLSNPEETIALNAADTPAVLDVANAPLSIQPGIEPLAIVEAVSDSSIISNQEITESKEVSCEHNISSENVVDTETCESNVQNTYASNISFGFFGLPTTPLARTSALNFRFGRF